MSENRASILCSGRSQPWLSRSLSGSRAPMWGRMICARCLRVIVLYRNRSVTFLRDRFLTAITRCPPLL